MGHMQQIISQEDAPPHQKHLWGYVGVYHLVFGTI